METTIPALKRFALPVPGTLAPQPVPQSQPDPVDRFEFSQPEVSTHDLVAAVAHAGQQAAMMGFFNPSYSTPMIYPGFGLTGW